jgi:hypothetical protein
MFPLLVIERSRNPLWGLPLLVGICVQIAFSDSPSAAASWLGLGFLQVLAILFLVKVPAPVNLLPVVRGVPILGMWLIFAVLSDSDWIRIAAVFMGLVSLWSVCLRDGSIEIWGDHLFIRHPFMTKAIYFRDIADVVTLESRLIKLLAFGNSSIPTVQIRLKREAAPLVAINPWSRSLSLNVPQEEAKSFVAEVRQRLHGLQDQQAVLAGQQP